MDFSQDNISAFDAISEAQKIAFAPMLFQATVCLRDFGILSFLDKKGDSGADIDEIVSESKLSKYAISVILDMGISGRLISFDEKEERYYLAKIGYFILYDKMSNANIDFTRDICYLGLSNLKESLLKGKACGLKYLGPWDTIYPALTSLPEPARSSWFKFDHLYSDVSFKEALQYVFDRKIHHIYDVGGNTGKFATCALSWDSEVEVTLIDLKEQLKVAKDNLEKTGFKDRVHFYPVNFLEPTILPNEADVWWMSQFLDCFAEEKVVEILKNISSIMKDDARVCILEPFCDNQRFAAASFSLNAGSLYFTTMANGTSRFFNLRDFKKYLAKASLQIDKSITGLGLAHTLLICSKIK